MHPIYIDFLTFEITSEITSLVRRQTDSIIDVGLLCVFPFEPGELSFFFCFLVMPVILGYYCSSICKMIVVYGDNSRVRLDTTLSTVDRTCCDWNIIDLLLTQLLLCSSQ